MKKATKIFIALFLIAVMAFAVAGCNADTENELQGKIDDLQSQIEDLNDRIAEMEEQLSERDKKIDQLEKELAEKCTGTFYTLQEAYDNGWLTQADVMSIAYYHNRGRIYNEEMMSEEYEPVPKTPEVLSELTELKIKSAAAKEYREIYNMQYAEADGFRITQYYGTYGKCVAVMMRDDYSGESGIVWTDTVAGVKIHYGSGRTMKIWRKTI